MGAAQTGGTLTVPFSILQGVLAGASREATFVTTLLKFGQEICSENLLFE